MRLALAPINPTVGDVGGNAALIVAGIGEARRAGADLVVFPELCLSGYPPRDLLLQEGFLEAVAAAAKGIGEGETAGIAAAFGAPLRADGGIANSLLMYRDNRLLEHHDKRLLPTYDVFDEDRYFTPGGRAVVAEIAGVRVGLAICEDLWKGEDVGFAARYRRAADPVAELVAAGAGVIVAPSASPFVLGKALRHGEILRRHASRHGVWVASVNQLGGNDELVFDGRCDVYAPGGERAAGGGPFSEEMVVFEIGAAGVGGGKVQSAKRRAQMSGGESLAVGGEWPQERQLLEALSLGLRDYLRKTGFSSVIVGVSGGIDSSVTAAVAARALGAGRVLGVLMPGPYSSEHSVADALELCGRLGVEHITAPIMPGYAAMKGVIDAAFAARSRAALGATMPDVADENLQSRLRGMTVMALSNRTGAMLLTTGNKSELAVGYSTLYGDMTGGLALLSDVSKTLVYRLALWMNANWAGAGFARAPIPQRSIDKAPSAELRPGQTDRDTLPPYEELDRIIERYVEGRQSAGRIAEETGLDAGLVGRIVRMIDLSEYKRKQLAIGLKVTSVAFGTGRRWPIAQGWRGCDGVTE